MLLAILSDIHANLEAFQAVIRDLERREPSMVLCLGDLIGYGPDPDEIVTLFRHNKYISVLGNHEAALKDPEMRNWLNFQAKENSIQTERLLSKDNLQYCRTLAENLVVENGLLVHGFPPDSVLQYLTAIGDETVASFFSQSDIEICFVGHTHDLLVVSWDGKKVVHDKFVNRKYQMQEECRYIINAGSVGQPRDGNNSAKYLLWNTTEKNIEVVYVPYDFKKTSKKIEKRGFPKAYGDRLW